MIRPGTGSLLLLAGVAALAVAHLVMTVQMGFWEGGAKSGSRLFLISTYSAACTLLLWFGHRSLRAMQKRTEADIIGRSTSQWEQLRSEFASELETLKAISREISEIGATVGLRLTEAERNVRQKSRFAEVEAAFAKFTELTGALLVRLGHLTELLLSPKLLAMLENLPAAKARGEEDYANIVSGIRQEARALITEAKTKTGRMGREEAYIVLAEGPHAAVINATYPRLLQLWKPTGDSDEAARERYAELEQVIAHVLGFQVASVGSKVPARS